MAARRRAERPFGGGESALPSLDGRAVQAYRQRLLTLKTELDDAEEAGVSTATIEQRAEFERLTEELAQSLGMGGTTRNGPNAAERARANVTQRIRTAIKRIADQNQRLGHHLRTSVRTGRFCGYFPPPSR